MSQYQFLTKPLKGCFCFLGVLAYRRERMVDCIPRNNIERPSRQWSATTCSLFAGNEIWFFIWSFMFPLLSLEWLKIFVFQGVFVVICFQFWGKNHHQFLSCFLTYWFDKFPLLMSFLVNIIQNKASGPSLPSHEDGY